MSDSIKPNPDLPRASFLTMFIATGFYSGYSPWASGTAGSLVGVLIYLIPGVSNPAILIPLIVCGFIVGARCSALVANRVGNVLTNSARLAKETFQWNNHASPDPSIVVIDEIVGMLISLAFLDVSFLTLGIAFVAFRVFDILKPFPIRQCERLQNGWGIMLDDVVAGIYANVATHLFLLGIYKFL